MAKGGSQKRSRAKRAHAAATEATDEPRSDATPEVAPRARVPFGAYAACAALIAAVFARALPYPLQSSWDDARFLTENPLVMRPSWHAFVAIVTRPQLEAYHPLHLLSYWIDAPWSGADPRLLHATSLALWIAAACVLLRALVQLGLARLPALVTVLVCTIHPVQVEVVSWATGRKDVLALLFAALALDAHLRADGSRGNALWSQLAYALGVLSKTTVLPLPLVLIAIDVLVRGKRLGRALAAQLPSLALACVMSALVLVIWGEHEMIRPAGPDVGNALTRVVSSLAHHVSTLSWPAHVAPMYATTALARPSPIDYASVLALVLLIAWLARRARAGSRHAALAFAGLLSFALLLTPVANLVPMVFPFQDRYGSLPLVGLALALGAGLDALRRTTAVAVVGAAVVIALAARTMEYQGAWRTELSLWGHATSTQPDAYYAWMKLCELRRKSGELHGAVLACRRLVELEPTRRTGHTALLLATALRDENVRELRPSRAERYAAAFHGAPDDPRALRGLAAQMLASGHLRALELPMARALVLEPFADDVLERAAAAHFAAGRPTLGAFYLRHMRMPTQRPELLAASASAERQRRAQGAPRVTD